MTVLKTPSLEEATVDTPSEAPLTQKAMLPIHVFFSVVVVVVVVFVVVLVVVLVVVGVVVVVAAASNPYAF